MELRYLYLRDRFIGFLIEFYIYNLNKVNMIMLRKVGGGDSLKVFFRKF